MQHDVNNLGTKLSVVRLLLQLPVDSFLKSLEAKKSWQHSNCWRAVARQLSIPYKRFGQNRDCEIWPKSVGCKIVDLRSRMPSLYPGACGFGDTRSRFLYIRDMPVNAHGNIDRNSSNSRNQRHVNRSEFLYRCLLHVEGFIKAMNSLEMTLKEEKGRIFKCLVAHSQLYSSKWDR